MNWKLAVTGLMVVGLAGGCTKTQQGAGIDAAGGAVVGGIVAASPTVTHDYQSVVVGALTGATAGALVGDALDETKNRSGEDVARLKTQNSTLESQAYDAQAEAKRLADENARLAAKLAEKTSDVKVEQKDGQIRFTILNEVLFDAGKAELRTEGLSVVDSVLDVIKKEYADRKIMVEGHSDNQPITHSAWKDNWDLSFARSMAVVKHFMSDKGVNGETLSALACGEFRPVADNATKEGQRQNRRAVIVVLPAASNIVVDHK